MARGGGYGIRRGGGGRFTVLGGQFGPTGGIETVDVSRVVEVRRGEEGVGVAARALVDSIVVGKTGELAGISGKQAG